MKRVFLSLLALTVCGCASKPSPITYRNVGRLLRTEGCPEINTGLLNKQATKVVTDRGFFVVLGTVSGMIGDPVRLGSDGVLYVGGDNSYELCN